ncbi:MaoC/PaaZ C-terminal domain-containing protein [Comamonadaceae bacterium G21597-S1]|nr:MaoC/PaaZ C-terminal domain-containing protein [Comamonadaceae bacterium G21597-S1]
MALDRGALGREGGPVEVRWTQRDALLYALGVGAGQDDPLKELEFTTENSAGINQRLLPTYAVVIVHNAGIRADLGPIDRSRAFHAEQAFVLHLPLPVEGRVHVSSRVVAIEDKGAGALVTTESSAVDAVTGELLISTTASAFIGGEGGFGGERKSARAASMPDRAPDVVLTAGTRPDQALLYRLSGDRNPLHSDPAFAARGGFARPILHGLCTYGSTGRVLLHAFCGSDPARMRSMSARFTRPVSPGENLSVQAWQEPEGVRFRTLNGAGQVVIDQGLMKSRMEQEQ